MQVMFICDILNIIGNAFCIYYLGWGVEGVAIPTVIARFLAAIILLYFIMDENYLLHIKSKQLYGF